MPTRNLVLRSFGPDIEKLSPNLLLTSLASGQVSKREGDMIEKVYFPINGLVSTRAILQSGHEIECACIGNTNAAGATATLGFYRPSTRYVCLADGHAGAITLPHLSSAMRASAVVERQMKFFAHAQMGYAIHVGVCNALHTAEQRLARWLMTASDVIGRPEIRLPQDELANVLGLQRSAVNLVLQRFKNEGLLEV